MVRNPQSERAAGWESAFHDWVAAALPAGWRLADERSGTAAPDITVFGPSGTTIAVDAKTVGEPSVLKVRSALAEPSTVSVLFVGDRFSPRVRALIEGADASWYEPEGEARLRLGPLYLSRERMPGRPRSVRGETRYIADPFTGSSGQIVSALLEQPDRDWKLTELAAQTGTSTGLVSRVLSTLDRDGYVERRRGATRVSDLVGLAGAHRQATLQTSSTRQTK